MGEDAVEELRRLKTSEQRVVLAALDRTRSGDIPASIQRRVVEVDSQPYIVLTLQEGLFVVLRRATDPEAMNRAASEGSFVVVTLGRDSEVALDA